MSRGFMLRLSVVRSFVTAFILFYSLLDSQNISCYRSNNLLCTAVACQIVCSVSFPVCMYLQRWHCSSFGYFTLVVGNFLLCISSALRCLRDYRVESLTFMLYYLKYFFCCIYLLLYCFCGLLLLCNYKYLLFKYILTLLLSYHFNLITLSLCVAFIF